MYNIILVSTLHRELGKCNSNELYKIIQSINPDVVFEELPPDLFDMLYSINEIPGEPPETKTVRRYLRHHAIKHLPVDIAFNSNLTRQFENLIDAFNRYDVHKRIEAEQIKMTESDGFAFLNSQKYRQLDEEKKQTEINLIEFMTNKLQLSRIYTSFYEEQDTRENAMLKNIYNYSKGNQYNQAVFLIGAEHKKSIMDKMPRFKKKSKLELKWNFDYFK